MHTSSALWACCFAVLCLAFAAAIHAGADYCARVTRESRRVTQRALELAEKAFEAACVVSRSHQDAATKYTSALAQVANQLSKDLDQRAAARVKLVNSALNPNEPATAETIEEPPTLPEVFQSGMLDDNAEMLRELTRKRNEKIDFAIRDNGVGTEEV